MLYCYIFAARPLIVTRLAANRALSEILNEGAFVSGQWGSKSHIRHAVPSIRYFDGFHGSFICRPAISVDFHHGLTVITV